MGKKIRCSVGLADMLTGMGFREIKRFDSVKDAKLYIRKQGLKGIPEPLRHIKGWKIRKIDDEDGDV